MLTGTPCDARVFDSSLSESHRDGDKRYPHSDDRYWIDPRVHSVEAMLRAGPASLLRGSGSSVLLQCNAPCAGILTA